MPTTITVTLEVPTPLERTVSRLRRVRRMPFRSSVGTDPRALAIAASNRWLLRALGRVR